MPKQQGQKRVQAKYWSLIALGMASKNGMDIEHFRKENKRFGFGITEKEIQEMNDEVLRHLEAVKRILNCEAIAL